MFQSVVSERFQSGVALVTWVRIPKEIILCLTMKNPSHAIWQQPGFKYARFRSLGKKFRPSVKLAKMWKPRYMHPSFIARTYVSFLSFPENSKLAKSETRSPIYSGGGFSFFFKLDSFVADRRRYKNIPIVIDWLMERLACRHVLTFRRLNWSIYYYQCWS